MKIIVIGATGTIGSEVAKALTQKQHEVVRASRKSEVKVNIDDPTSVRSLFATIQDVDAVVCCAGNATFKPFAELSDADYELGLRSNLMGQVTVARVAKDRLRDRGSIVRCIRCPEAHQSRLSMQAWKASCVPPHWKCREVCESMPSVLRRSRRRWSSSEWTQLRGKRRQRWPRPISPPWRGSTKGRSSTLV
jgi:NADP-dependent 3-hydroxy acid dehydrogenase YdfG